MLNFLISHDEMKGNGGTVYTASGLENRFEIGREIKCNVSSAFVVNHENIAKIIVQ